MPKTQKMNLFDFQWNRADGTVYNPELLRGKKVLLVNTASACGLTPQYAQLQELYEEVGNEKLEIIAFPCNDFAGQEPGSMEEILDFCATNYGVTFPIMEKVTILGDNPHPLFKKIKTTIGKDVQWNFHKFLFDSTGDFFMELAPQTSPFDSTLIDWIYAH